MGGIQIYIPESNMASKLKMASTQIQLLPKDIFGVKVHERLLKNLGCHGCAWKIY